jgi:hypothetical protein
MDNEQLIKDVIRWMITTKNTEMLDESDVDLVYKYYVTEQVGNVPQADSVQPLLAEVRKVLLEVKDAIREAESKEYYALTSLGYNESISIIQKFIDTIK